MDEALTGGSLCSGSGGLDLGLERALGVTWAWHCESDPAASRILAARWPDIPNHGDLFETDWSNVERVDLIAAGFPCFVAGTLILTEGGYRPIEELSVGDHVLTHEGRWRPITTTHATPDAPLRRVSAPGADLVCTDDHPFYARLASYDRYRPRDLGAPEWVDAADLRPQHFLGQVVPQPDAAWGSRPFWQLVGRYLADGWMVDRKGRKNGRIVICCARDESDALEALIESAGYCATASHEGAVSKYHITKGDLYRFLQPFGRLAHGKRLPGFLHRLDRDSAEAVLSGYLDGDGNLDEAQRCWRATTVSPALAYGIALLAHQARGVVASVHRYERAAETQIEGRTVNQRAEYQVRIPLSNRSCVVEGAYGWKKVKRNERLADRATVYNIAVEEDESYVANGAIVHNCPDYSLAGKRAGIDGEHGQVWIAVAAALRALRPRYVVLENVDAIRSAPGPLDGAPGESAVGTVLADLADLGYRWAYDRIRAADVGAPHGRLRWFCVAALPSSPDAVGSGVDADRRLPRRGQGAHRPDGSAPSALAAGPEMDGAADALADGPRAAADPVGVGLDRGGTGNPGGPEDEGWGGASLRDLPRLIDAAADADPERVARAAPGELDGGSGAGEEPRASGEEGEAEHGVTGRARGRSDDPTRLLPTPTPTAGDGKSSGSRNLEGSKAHAGVSLTDAVQMGGSTTPRLLPTPQAADGDGGRQEKGAMGRAGVRPSGHKATLPLPTAVAMRDELTETPFAQPVEEGQLEFLPTPTCYVGDRVEGQLSTEVAMLPTPVANPDNPGAGGELRAAITHGPGRRNETGIDTLGRPNRGRSSDQSDLLPTPQAADGDRTSEQNLRHYSEGTDNPTLLGAARRSEVVWGVYEAAVRRWEAVLGRDAPAPTDEKGRLDPPFVEWMLGYPEDWFNVDGVSRTRKLRALGNSVQVQCGEAVGGWLAFLVESGLLD